MKVYSTIQYNGRPLTLDGTYTEGEKQERDYPGSPHSFELESVLICDVDITDLLSEEELENISEFYLENR